MNDIVIVRGGGDIATGVIQKLYRSGFKVIVTEINNPTSIRRKVCLSEAIYEGEVRVENLVGVYSESLKDIMNAWHNNKIPVLKDPKVRILKDINVTAIIDATLSKRNIGTNKCMAPITIALGPGYVGGQDVDVVIETQRGHNLGTLVFQGEASKNTGIPGIIKGYGIERVIYSPCEGKLKIIKDIGEVVNKGDVICLVNDSNVYATIPGVLRGMIRDGLYVKKGLKIADIDPRITEIENCNRVSDKARNIGGATLEALMYMKNIKGGYVYGREIAEKNIR